jgi:hypothetical protein
MSGRFTAKEWREENSALNGGEQPRACPGCGRTGFYRTRDDHPDKRGRQFRACTFCGFWQDVEGEPHRRIRYECHGHAATSKPDQAWTCPECGKRFEPKDSVPWPSDDPSHQWWQVPQNLSQDEYITYWQLEWGHDAKPFGVV